MIISGKRFSSGRRQARGTAQGTGANSWNRHVATLKSFVAFSQRHGWINDEVDLVRALERRRAAEDHSKALDRETLDRLLTSRNVGVRDRCLWRLLYESAAQATEVLNLNLNVEDIDLIARRAVIISKGGDTDVLHFASGTARLLPRKRGPRPAPPIRVAQAWARDPRRDLQPHQSRPRGSGPVTESSK